MIDHIGISVSDYPRSRAFYVSALAPLGIEAVMDLTREQTGTYKGTGFGSEGRPWFWIGAGGGRNGATHVAFNAATRKDVDLFHAAALAAGGRDNGAPGIRPHYHANYYGAFALDPDGNNIEAVCHSADG